MNKNVRQLPNTTCKQILSYIGWEGGFNEFACFVGEAGLCASSDTQEWWYTGQVRKRVLESKEKIICRCLTSKRDFDQRSLFREFTYLKHLTRQDPLSLAFICSKEWGRRPPASSEDRRLLANDVTTNDQASRYYSQVHYPLTSVSKMKLSFIAYTPQEFYDVPGYDPYTSFPCIRDRANNILPNRGHPNIHLNYMNYFSGPDVPLAWKFNFDLCSPYPNMYEEPVLINHFVGIEPTRIPNVNGLIRYRYI